MSEPKTKNTKATFSKGEDPCAFRMTARDLANIFSISHRRVNDLAKDGIFQRGDDNCFGLGEAVKAMLAFKSSAPKDSVDISIDRAKLETEMERARKLKLQNEKEEGLLVDARGVEVEWARMISIAKSRIWALPSRVAKELAVEDSPKAVRDRLKEELRIILDDLSKGTEDDDPE